MKVILGLLVSVFAVSAVHADPVPSNAQAVVDATDAMGTMNTNDLRVLVENALSQFQAVITKSENLGDVEKENLSYEMEKQFEKLQDVLDATYDDATSLGDRGFPVGVIVTIGGGVSLPAVYVPALQYGPGAEAGLAFFLKKNTYLSESIRGASVVIGSASLEAFHPRTDQPNKDVEKGVSIKVLYAHNREAVSLADFEGFYTGATVKTTWLGGKHLGEIYTKPQTCNGINPFDCDVYIYSYRFGTDPKDTGADLRELYVNFPHSNDKRGVTWKQGVRNLTNAFGR